MAHPIPESSESQFSAQVMNLRHYWHVVLERRWLVLTAFISVFVLCLVYLYKAPKIYLASARLQINREEEGSFSLKEMISGGIEQDYLQTQYKNLMNRELLQKVYSELKLETAYAADQDPMRALANDITIVPMRMTRLVDIKVERPEKALAARIANELAAQFIKQNLNRKHAKTDDTVKFLQAQAQSMETNVTAADQELQNFRQSQKFSSLDAERNTIYLALSQAQEAYAKAKSEAKTLETTVAALEQHQREGKSFETFPTVTSDLVVAQAQVELAKHETELAALLKKYKDKHYAVIAARSKVESAREAVQTAARQVADTLRSRASLAHRNEVALKSTVDDWETKQQEWNQAKLRYDVLARRAESSKLLFNKVLERMKEIELLGQDKANNIVLVQAAFEPVRHVKPRVVVTLLLGLVGGLAIAVGLAFFVNYLDDSIKSQDDVETYLHLPFLGYVPNIKSNSIVERDLQAHLHAQSNAAEAFRTIRAALGLTHKAEKLRLVTVTSTIPSEGKSLVASNLAIVLAQTGLKVLLVDADLRRPSVHKTFQLHSPVGLAAYLQETAKNLDELVHTTEVPNLDVVCCGATPQTPSELIGSKRMTLFLQEAGKRYDRIMLDCPPVSAVSDPLVISAMADGVIFVTKFNKIRREHARKTIQRIQNAGIHICGAVLNDIDFEGRDSYYYSYYYYQNRYYSSHYRTEAKPAGEPAKAVPAKKA
jgi:capsular exopolysaccharide synthesis family protein